MTLDTFDRAYNLAASLHPKGHVSVETFRNVLDSAQAHQITAELVRKEAEVESKKIWANIL